MFQMCNKVVLLAFQRCLSVSRVFQGRFKGVTFDKKKQYAIDLITGPKLQGVGGQKRFSQKPKFYLFFMKPSLIEKMYIIIVFCKCVQIQHD